MPSVPSSLEAIFRQALDGDEQDEQERSAVDEKILDAALTTMTAYGTQKTSMEDIAHAARLSRRTVFRRFGSKEDLIARLFLREMRRVVDMVRDVAASNPDPVAGMAEIFVNIVQLPDRYPAIKRLTSVEPELLIAMMRSGEPAMIDLLQSFIADRLRSGQRRGAISSRSADEIADVLVRLTFGYVFVPSRVAETSDTPALRALAIAIVEPIVRSTESQ